MHFLSRPAVRVALLVAFVLAGGALRLTDINWDRFQHVHPDERFVVWVADTMEWPGDVTGGFFAQLGVALDPATSPLNPLRWPPDAEESAGEPRNFAYGHFPLYLLLGGANAGAAVGRWFGETTLAFPAWMQPVHTVGRQLADYNYLSLVGRALSALADLGTLLLVYAMGCRVGRRLSPGTGQVNHAPEIGNAVGLLAAGAYAFSVLPIQLSHFAAVDALLTFFVAATVALAARYAEQGGRWVSVAAGVTAGLAVGSKFSAVMLVLPLLVAASFRLPDILLGRKALIILGRLVVPAFAAVLTFAVTNPFALLELNLFVGQIFSQNAMVNGVMDAPYTRQYIGTIPYAYFVQQLSQWGLGWPLGLLAWTGLVWMLVQFGLGRAGVAATVLLAWAFPYLVVTGGFHTKFLRYMAPLAPFLLVFGAAFAVAGYHWLSARWGKAGRSAWVAAAIVTSLATILWSLAFTNVYRQEHPWIQASNWIYHNVPEGSKILTEEWDDALPLAMDEIAERPPRRDYERVELPVWDPDNTEKVERLAAELASADTLTIASNRVYAPVSRLAGRYPMTAQYYRQLFSGDLGYELVAEFSAYPRLGAVVVPDENADESFSVYDHPRAFIFMNTGRLQVEELVARLQHFSLEYESYKTPGMASLRRQTPEPDRSLTLAQPVESLPDVTDYRWNEAASRSPAIAVVLWWLVISIFGWFAWPLLFPLARGLADRGHGLARAAGWLLFGWLHWMGVSLGLWKNALPPLLLLLLLLVLAGRVAWTALRGQMAEFWREHRRLILGQEALFAGAFVLFVLVRLLNPDLWHPWNGGEKFMEFAFLNATLRSPVFPPYDPYFAGGILNYYYFGLYLVGLPVRLTGIFAEVAFNLAVPSLFALTAAGVFSVAYSLAAPLRGVLREIQPAPTDAPRPVMVGALAVVLTVLLGNLTGLEWAVNALANVMRGGSLPFDYWAASRVIPFTINEFPLWTFIFADLHPHLISMPFGLLVAGLALDWLINRPLTWRPWVLKLAVLALALGALGAINTWDLPAYTLLVAAVLCLAAWRAPGSPGRRSASVIAAVLTAAGVVVLAVVAYWPFYANYQAQVGGGEGGFLGRYLGWVREASPLRPWLLIWGCFLFLALSYVVVELLAGRVAAEVRSGREDREGRRRLFGVLILVALLVIVAALGRPTAAIAALPLFLVVPLVISRRGSPGSSFTGLLLMLGLGIVAGIELVYLRDFLEGGDWYRMNTLFKFSVPAWLFLGLAGGHILARLWTLTNRAPAWLALPWQVAAGALVAGGLVFLLVGVRARIEDRFPDAQPATGTLDGLAYMTVGEYTWPDGDHRIALQGEYEALKWLLDNVKGTPVVAEAPAGGYTVEGEPVSYDYYRAGGLRVASVTGLPTFVGQHQYEQRPAEQVSEQTARGIEFFRTTDVARARQLMRELQVRYVYVGELERTLFAPEALRKFDVLVEAGELGVAFRNDDVTIYRVLRRRLRVAMDISVRR